MRLSTLNIAWRNLGRNRKRTGLALAAIATGQFALIVACAVYHGFSDKILEEVTGPLLGDVQIQARDWRKERAVDSTLGDLDGTVAEMRRDPSVESVAPRIFCPALAAVGETTDAVVVVGVDVAAERARGGLLAAVEPTRLPGGQRVLVGRALAKTLAVSEGGEIAIVGQTADGFPTDALFAVAGTISTPVELVDTTGVVMALDTAQGFFEMPDQAHQITVRGRPGTDARALASALAARPLPAGAEVISWRDAVPFIASMIDMLDVAGFFVIALLFIAAIAGITNTLMTSTFERLHEFGMLLGLGCSPGKIVGLIFMEAVVLGLAGVVAGTVLGLPTVLAMSMSGVDVMGLSGEGAGSAAMGGMAFPGLIFPRAEATDALAGAVAVLLTSMLAALWPASYAARLEPTEAMRS